MILTTKFLDYASLCRLYQCNLTWFGILSDEQTWLILLQVHFQVSQPLLDYTPWQTYDLYFFSQGNHCQFCSTPAVEQLCLDCFDKAWTVALEHYKTDDVVSMANTASQGPEGDALTFIYASQEHEKNEDITDAEFIIDDYESVLDLCKYDHMALFSRTWIDLSTGGMSGFWSQAGHESD